MILWTIHNQAAYSAFKKNKILKGDWRRAEDKSFLPAYKWMANQMVNRGIMEKPESFLWAWHTYWDEKRRRPDFRCESLKGQLKYHKVMYRITVDVPDDKVLLSDYELWHNVLSGFHTCLNEKEWNRIYPERLVLERAKGGIYHGTSTKEKIEKSWEQIFDLDIKFNGTADTEWIGNDLFIQACTPYFKWKWVNKVEKFTHKGKSSTVFMR